MINANANARTIPLVTNNHLQFTTYHLSLINYHLPFTSNHLPLTTCHLPLTTEGGIQIWLPMSLKWHQRGWQGPGGTLTITYNLPLTTYHLPLTTYHLPIITYHSLLTTYHIILLAFYIWFPPNPYRRIRWHGQWSSPVEWKSCNRETTQPLESKLILVPIPFNFTKTTKKSSSFNC